MTYKKLVEMIANIKSIEDIHEAGYQIDRAFDTAQKITWQDHETLYKIINNLYKIYEN